MWTLDAPEPLTHEGVLYVVELLLACVRRGPFLLHAPQPGFLVSGSSCQQCLEGHIQKLHAFQCEVVLAHRVLGRDILPECYAFGDWETVSIFPMEGRIPCGPQGMREL